MSPRPAQPPPLHNSHHDTATHIEAGQYIIADYCIAHKRCTRFYCALFCCHHVIDMSKFIICFVYSYPSWLFHWRWDDNIVAPMPVKIYTRHVVAKRRSSSQSRTQRSECVHSSWDILSSWRHQMETFLALLSLCAGNPAVTGGFPSQRDSNADVCLLSVWTNCWTNTRLTGNSMLHEGHLTLPWCISERHAILLHIPIILPCMAFLCWILCWTKSVNQSINQSIYLSRSTQLRSTFSGFIFLHNSRLLSAGRRLNPI